MFVFLDSHNSVQNVVDIGISWTRSYSSPSMSMFHTRSMVTIMKWLVPESGWVKFNTVGAISLNSYLAVIERVIRNIDGN